jgi:hypothetical protein
MAGASNTERKTSIVIETTAGSTPATPSFKRLPVNVLNMSANPRVVEQRSIIAGGQRTGISRNGFAVSGSLSSGLIYGEFDDFFESMFQGSFASDVLKNANDTVAMTIEDSIPQGSGGSLAYLRYRGVEATGGTLNLVAGQDAALSFDLIGSGSDDAATSIITGATYADAGSFDTIGSGSDIGTITMSGMGDLDCMRSCEVRFTKEGKDENLRISSDDLCGISRGAMLPVVAGEFYVEDNFVDIYNASRAGTSFALTIPIGSVANEKYELFFPDCEFVEAPLVTGENGPAFQNFSIMPKFDTTEDCTVRLTRNIA